MEILNDCLSRRDDAKQELDEFQASSRELEAELEAQLTSCETKNRELVVTNSKQSTEIEMLRVSGQLNKINFCNR